MMLAIAIAGAVLVALIICFVCAICVSSYLSRRKVLNAYYIGSWSLFRVRV